MFPIRSVIICLRRKKWKVNRFTVVLMWLFFVNSFQVVEQNDIHNNGGP